MTVYVKNKIDCYIYQLIIIINFTLLKNIHKFFIIFFGVKLSSNFLYYFSKSHDDERARAPARTHAPLQKNIFYPHHTHHTPYRAYHKNCVWYYTIYSDYYYTTIYTILS